MLEDMMADQAPPGNDWRGKKHEAGRKANGNGHAGYASQQDKPFTKRQPDPPPDPDYERKVRALFRKLAKQYHPDLATDEEQKKRHEQLMAEINQAYSAKDLDALEQLAESRNLDSTEPAKTPAAELERLQAELRQLEMMIFDIERTIRELDLSPAMHMRSELKADQADGRDSLSELEAEFKTRIALLQEQLIALGADIRIDG
jgi:DNA repair exonuclease SbcCD ATPase subunit